LYIDLVDDHLDTTSDTKVTTFPDLVTIESGFQIPASLASGFAVDMNVSLWLELSYLHVQLPSTFLGIRLRLERGKQWETISFSKSLPRGINVPIKEN
jgi:hypothetical protein